MLGVGGVFVFFAYLHLRRVGEGEEGIMWVNSFSSKKKGKTWDTM